MARAKRTKRAEARRRYRAATTGPVVEGDDDLDVPEIPAAALPRVHRDRRPASAREPASGAPARAGFVGSLRAAAGPVDIPGDLRAFPSIVLHSRSGWLPALVIAVTTIAMLIPSLASNQLVAMAGNIVLTPPPMIIAFLAGMLAPRGAWLMGGLLSLLAGVCYLVVAVVATSGIDVRVTTLGFTFVISPDQKSAILQSVAQAALITAPLFGIAVGAFAGFYRRFLNMSSPQRQAARKR